MRRSNARAGSSDGQPRAPRLSRGTRNFDDFTVRDAAVQDVEPVATLLREVYVGEGLIRADRAPTIDGVRLQVAVGGLLVAEELSTPTLLGTVALVTARNPCRAGEPGPRRISALAVRAAAWSRGGSGAAAGVHAPVGGHGPGRSGVDDSAPDGRSAAPSPDGLPPAARSRLHRRPQPADGLRGRPLRTRPPPDVAGRPAGAQISCQWFAAMTAPRSDTRSGRSSSESRAPLAAPRSDTSCDVDPQR